MQTLGLLFTSVYMKFIFSLHRFTLGLLTNDFFPGKIPLLGIVQIQRKHEVKPELESVWCLFYVIMTLLWKSEVIVYLTLFSQSQFCIHSFRQILKHLINKTIYLPLLFHLKNIPKAKSDAKMHAVETRFNPTQVMSDLDKIIFSAYSRLSPNFTAHSRLTSKFLPHL